MSKAQQTHPHSDGGTYRTLQFAKTTRGWAIDLIEWTTYKGEVLYQVARVNPQGSAFTLHTARSESKARALANREWLADREGAKPREMILA